MNFYKIDSRHKVKQVLDNLALNLIDNWNFEKPVQILFKEYKNPRTLSQNALVHVWFAEIAKAMKLKGFTYVQDNQTLYLSEDDVKLMLKDKFLGYRDIVRGKMVIKDQLVSTKKLDKGEMMRFLDEVYGWAFDRGIQLKTPEDSEYMKLRRKQDA